MKRFILFLSFLLAIAAGYLVYLYDKQQQDVINIRHFMNGDILDSLIVVDAIGLNEAMAPYEQGLTEYTTAQIDSIFNKYCKHK